jgi:hypothetical protein
MFVEVMEIPVVQPYSLPLTVLSHGWVNLLPYYWDQKKKILRRQEKITHNAEPITLEISQEQNHQLRILAKSNRKISKSAKNNIAKRIKRALSTDSDCREFHKVARKLDKGVANILVKGGGRFLKGTTLFEDIVKTLFTTNASWSSTQRMVNNFIKIYGTDGAFPVPFDLVNVTENDLREKVKIGYRARYLVAILELFVGNSSGNLENIPSKIPGLGPYGMAHIRFLNNDFSIIPIDSEVRGFCNSFYGLKSDDQIIEAYSSWGKYAFLGYKLSRHVKNNNWIG